MLEDILASIIFATNQQPEMRHHPLTYNKLHHFLGIILAMALAPKGDQRDLWNAESEGPIPAMNFGRFMARDEFDSILRSLQLSMFGKDDLQLDLWIPFRPAIECFNHSQQAGISPGTYLCIDESMCAWRGMSLKVEDTLCGLPHTTKIIRKPEPVGIELRNLACGETSIILQLEIMDGKDAMQNKEFAEFGSGTSSVLRLTAPWAGTPRAVVGDSAFASVKTAKALLDIRGLGFVGLVKTAHKLFPKGYLEDYPYPRKRAHATLQANIEGHKYIAVGWKDRKRKTFIATSGITTPAQTQALKRKAQPEDNTDSPCVRYFIEVPCPSIVEHYFNTANAIDVHNHLCQGGLELERRWRAQRWWHRAFATFIVICETDAYLVFLHFHPNKAVTVNLKHEKFTRELCMQLLQFDSEHINGPSMHLRPRLKESAPALTLNGKNCQQAYTLRKHERASAIHK